MSAWTPKTRTPTRRGWYITRTDEGMVDWRAWGCGAWWKQLKGGWIEWYDGDGKAMTYAWKKDSRQNINLDRCELKEPSL